MKTIIEYILHNLPPKPERISDCSTYRFYCYLLSIRLRTMLIEMEKNAHENNH